MGTTGLYHLITHLADSVVRRNLVAASKCHIDVRVAGSNVACWLFGCNTAWGFSDAFVALDSITPSDACPSCGCSMAAHTESEVQSCNAIMSEVR